MTQVGIDAAEKLSLAPGEIHLWLTYYDAIDDESLLTSYRELLNDAERAQQTRFYFEKDRKRYLVTRALVRTTLSRYASIAPTDWRFVPNDYGRPEIANAIQAPLKLIFNISHTRGLIALAIANDRALGVDVENLVAREVSLDIAYRFFAPEEAGALALVATERQRHRFFEYWTLKESYIKARGMGLSIPLDQFSFGLSDTENIKLAIDSRLNDRPDRWQFWQLHPSDEHLLALCAERVHCEQPRITIRHSTPLKCDETIEVKMGRSSLS